MQCKRTSSGQPDLASTLTASATSASVEPPVDKITPSLQRPISSRKGRFVISPDATLTAAIFNSSTRNRKLSESNTEQKNPILRSLQYRLRSSTAECESSSALQRSS